MRFKVVRASEHLSDAKPCDSAVRSEDGKRWEIEIAAPEDLVALMDEVGCGLAIQYGDPPIIWIHDDYME